MAKATVYTQTLGTNAYSNGYGNSTTSVVWIPSFPRRPGPAWASVKRPPWHGREVHAATRRRPQGSGWAPHHRPQPERRPWPSPQPPEHQQHWTHVSAPRARPGGRFRTVHGGTRPW